jgi:hypothetical protein
MLDYVRRGNENKVRLTIIFLLMGILFSKVNIVLSRHL